MLAFGWDFFLDFGDTFLGPEPPPASVQNLSPGKITVPQSGQGSPNLAPQDLRTFLSPH